jgi:hypothetical protein
MKNKQMTAVEWLQERINIGLTYEQEVLFEGLFEQAKEMEKQQIIDAYRDGRSDQQSEKASRFYNRNAEFYYNETYKN